MKRREVLTLIGGVGSLYAATNSTLKGNRTGLAQ
jgi:hypothetical protein